MMPTLLRIILEVAIPSYKVIIRSNVKYFHSVLQYIHQIFVNFVGLTFSSRKAVGSFLNSFIYLF